MTYVITLKGFRDTVKLSEITGKSFYVCAQVHFIASQEEDLFCMSHCWGIWDLKILRTTDRWISIHFPRGPLWSSLHLSFVITQISTAVLVRMLWSAKSSKSDLNCPNQKQTKSLTRVTEMNNLAHFTWDLMQGAKMSPKALFLTLLLWCLFWVYQKIIYQDRILTCLPWWSATFQLPAFPFILCWRERES